MGEVGSLHEGEAEYCDRQPTSVDSTLNEPVLSAKAN